MNQEIREHWNFDRYSPDVRQNIIRILLQLQPYGYADNFLRHEEAYLSGKVNCQFDPAIALIEQWIMKGMVHGQVLLEAPNLHTPFDHYEFRSSIEANCFSMGFFLVSLIEEYEDYNEGREDYYGELNLWVFRLKTGMYQIFFADDSDWQEWVDDVKYVSKTSVEELKSRGELL